MNQFAELTSAEWGYVPPYPEAGPRELAERLVLEVRQGIDDLRILSVEHEPAGNNPGFERVYAQLSLSKELFDLLMNGPAGYRAQYFAGEKTGEAYNALLVESILPILLDNDQLRTADVTEELCLKSLRGEHTKLWFSKEVTSPDYEPCLLKLPEAITAGRWIEYWRAKPRPHKGLLAPQPDEPCVLLNGTFLHPADWRSWNQKPNRSQDIWQRGWT